MHEIFHSIGLFSSGKAFAVLIEQRVYFEMSTEKFAIWKEEENPRNMVTL